MKSVVLLFATLIFCSAAQAQTIPDTLDNRRYFPLAVGNEWHYEIYAFASAIKTYQRVKIVADTIADNRHYFKMQNEGFDFALRLENLSIKWLRYNQAGAVITIPDISTDVDTDDTLTYWYHADFGDTLIVDDRPAIVEGSYDSTIVFLDSVEFAAVKTLNIPDPLAGMCCYKSQVVAADVGLIEQHTFDGPDTFLAYGKIGGTVYGSPAITVGRDDPVEVPRMRVHALYPNPAQADVRVVYEVAQAGGMTLEIYDMLGRRLRRDPSFQAEVGTNVWHIDVSGLSAGTYVVVVKSEQGRREGRVLTVVR